jgi:acetylornithine deacetylase/succinyl-diaminopimelate desuccinylase-like protein
MDLVQAVREHLPTVRADLEALVAIPSISSEPEHAVDLQRSAEAIAALLIGAGCPEVEVVSAGGGPAVLGRCPAPPGRPTVCLYAHHDVQPTGDPSVWTSPPFRAAVRGNRLYGRGCSDDKGGLAVHLAVLRVFGGRPPVGVTVFVEGEEEVGSPTLGAVLAAHHDRLRADVYVIADSANWAVGEPAFTTTLRGLADCVVEVRTLDHAVHSGAYGGVAPDALTALCRLLATLHDDEGNVAIVGLHHGTGPDLVYPPDRLRVESGVLEGVDYLGSGPVVDRLWSRPAVSVIAVDTTSIAQASNTLVPSARAKISLRVAPGDDARRALQRLREHLQAHAPWGARVTVTDGEVGEPAVIGFEGAVADAAHSAFTTAWGREPVLIGQGGSIPLVAEFADAYPDATILVTAVGDPDSRPHGIDESLHLGDFAAACVAEALFLQGLADQTSRTAGRS